MMAEVTDDEGSFARDMCALLESGEGADVTLVVGDSELPAHSAVLQARSSVFAAMLRSDMREARTRRIEITDMQEVVLQKMLLFMYSDTVPELETMAGELLAAADKYNLPLLKKLCEQQLAEGLNVENAATTAALAVLHRSPGLKTSAVEFMASHPEVLATAGWAQLLRGGAEAAVEISSQLAGRLPPGASADRNLSLEEKNRKLIEAAQVGAVEELQALLASGADVEARTENTETALHWAAYRGHTQAVKCLLDGGAEAGSRTGWQTTALHYAAEGGHTDVVRLLVASSADPNSRSRKGWTPLHYAAMYGHTEAVTALLEAGADKGIEDEDGSTPLDFATQHQQKLLEKLT